MDQLYERKIYDKLTGYINNKDCPKSVLVLMGARQVGKTTCIEKIAKETSAVFLNLERHPSIAESIDQCADFDEFTDYLREEHRFVPGEQALIIDESQYSQNLSQFIRFMKEEWQTSSVLLTGSLVSEMFPKGKRQPVGQMRFASMWPMSFVEFLKAASQNSLVKEIESFHFKSSFSSGKYERLLAWYEKYLRVGGLPEVVNYFLDGKDYIALRKDLYKSYENDFVRYFSLDKVNLFKRALEAVAANIGSPSKDTQVVRPDASGYKVVGDIFSRLEAWKLVIKCEQMSLEPEQNKVFPKRYLYDIGIANDLRLKGLTEVRLNDLDSNVLRTPVGGIVENAVAKDLVQQDFHELFGIRFGANSEIDFGIKHNGIVYPLECKLSLRFKGQYLSAIKRYQDRMNSASNKAFLLYGGMPRVEGNIFCMPFMLASQMHRFI